MKNRSNKHASVTYKTYADTFIHEEVGEYVGYGIIALDENGVELDRVPDVALDEAFVEDLAKSMTDNGVSLLHLWEVVEDAIS
ncbi:MAG: hypothetical protein IJX38_06750 [Clostridia bacterium]|nr:hypothetical protein [Clostridia bacterium]